MKWRVLPILVVGLLLVVALTLVACGAASTPCPECPEAAACPECPEAAACPECPEAAACPECPACPEAAGAAACPFQEEWAGSGHADAEAEAFVHWNEDDPKEIPTNCAACHSEPGYLDFLGADGSAAGVVDKAAPVGTTVTCDTCHNQAAMDLSVVTFPSGISLTVEGPEARCMVCHQGRASTVQVDAAIADAGLTDDDTVSPDLGFTNIHYKAAAATRYGTLVKGGYEYEGKAYDAKFDHVEGFVGCIDCHNQHTLELRLEKCAVCHEGVASVDDVKNIRLAGSQRDYDGDGDVEEGIYYEIEGLQGMLMPAIQAYANEVSGKAIVYDPAAHPYFFIDADANGTHDEGEEAYDAWTGRLAKATYNYQTSLKDPGAYAHGGKYIIQLLYDSIESLNEKIATPVDLSKASRIDAGHFASSEEAWRHWDADPAVEAGCVKCHQAEGIPQFLENAANIAMPQSGSMNCATCHDFANWPARYPVAEVEFPSGATIDSGNPDTNLCLECHQGRASTVQVNQAVAGMDPDAVSDQLRFRNVHYFAAGATLFGNEVQGAYQYEGKEYLGRFAHVEPYSNCSQCHATHGLTVKAEECSACHANVTGEEDLSAIRMATTDYDGDGDAAEGVAGEIGTMMDALYAAIQAYAADTAGAPIQYSATSYPYFFADPNANGTIDEGEEGFAAWTPRLLEAAYNYQYVQKDPGAFAHNAKYVMQFVYDSIEDLGGDVSGMTRP